MCNGLRGSKMHQRSCHVIKDFEIETFEPQETSQLYNVTSQREHEIDLSAMPTIKPSIRLPSSYFDWKLANDFFDIVLPIADVNKSHINIEVSQMTSIIYDYFHSNFGPIENSILSHFVMKYRDYSNPMLKSSLNALEVTNDEPNEI